MLWRVQSKSLVTTIVAVAAIISSCVPALASSNKTGDIAAEELAKKIIINRDKKQSVWTVSSFRVMAPLPKKNATAQQTETHNNSAAWLLAKLDRTTGATDITVRWQHYVYPNDTLAFTSSTVKLPSYEKQAGPNIVSERVTDCRDGYTMSDPYTVYTYSRGCNEHMNYALPVTIGVLSFLALRTETDPDTPMAITFKGEGTDGKPATSLFYFYPTEAKAMITELEKLQALAKLSGGKP